MPEETIWKGTSSHWKNFKPNVLTVLTFGAALFLHFWSATQFGLWVFIVPVLVAIWAAWNWLCISTTVYHLSTERLVTTHGILTKVTDTLELYRVRDTQIIQPLLLRILGLHNIHICTNDSTTSELLLDFIPASLGLGDRLRKSVEECREAKRVRSLDVISDQSTGHHPEA